MTLRSTIENSARDALQTLLAASLPDVDVASKWPDADKRLPTKAISIVFGGSRNDDAVQPEVDAIEKIHDAMTQTILGAASDLGTTLSLLNLCRTSYEAVHRLDVSVHQASDTANAIAAPAATTLAEGLTLATEMLATLPLHFVSAAHEHADTGTVLSGSPPTDLPSLSAATVTIQLALNQHYTARVYVWRVAACEQPVQLDVWTQYEAQRDDLIAQLEPLLHAGEDQPENSILVDLPNGWPGKAEFLFENPRRMDNADSVKRGEYRATYPGTLAFFLLVRSQQPRFTQAILQDLLGATLGVAN